MATLTTWHRLAVINILLSITLMVLLSITSTSFGIDSHTAAILESGQASTVESTSVASGETLTLRYWTAPTTLNPYVSNASQNVDAAALVLEPLVQFDETGYLHPVLTTEIPTVDNGGLTADFMTVTWKLRTDIVWSDGTPFTSADVVFTYDYCSHPDTGCVHNSAFDVISSVTAIDANTVEMGFNAPTSFPFSVFATSSMPILQKNQFADCIGAAAAGCIAENEGPIGTGPFVVSSFESGGNATYLANARYREEGKPYFAEVTLIGGGLSDEAAAAVLILDTADFAWNTQATVDTLNQLAKGDKGWFERNQSSSVERLIINFTNPDPALGDDRSLWLNGTNPHPFLTDLTIRQALSMAIDRQHIRDTLYGPVANPTCDLIRGPERYVSGNNAACLTQDIAGANALLDAAGIVDTDDDNIREKDGIPLSILFQTSTNSVRQETQALIQEWWRQIGVETTLRDIPASTFFGGDPSSPDTYSKFYADVEMYTNGPFANEFATYLAAWRTSEMPTPDNNWFGINIPRYANPTYESLHTTLTQTSDLDTRANLVQQLNDILVQDYVMIPLVHRAVLVARGDDLTGVRPPASDSALWNIADWARLEPLVVDLSFTGQANIFGAGKTTPPAPGGGGGGTLPSSVAFAAQSYRTMSFANLTIVSQSQNRARTCAITDLDGITTCNGGTNISAYDGISGIRHDSRSHFVVGVFLTDEAPQDPSPATLDVTNANDEDSFSPELNQLFFIGDGRNADGEAQAFVVPQGATRLFLGFADAADYDASIATLPGDYDDNVGVVSAKSRYESYLPAITK